MTTQVAIRRAGGSVSPEAAAAQAREGERAQSAATWLRELGLIGAVFTIWGAALACFAPDPWELFLDNAPIIPLAIVGAAFANATAVGGGFVFVPLFSWGYGLEPAACLKLALGTQAFGMTSGTFGWSRACIDLRALRHACAASGAGMIIGTFFLVPEGAWIPALFGVTSLLIAGALVLEGRMPERATAGRTKESTHTTPFSLACLAGGVVNALVSIGIGEVVALWLLLREQAPIGRAIGTGVATLAFCSVLGLVLHGALGGLPWDYLAFTAPGVIVGGRLGARLARGLENRRARYPSSRPGHPLKRLVAGVIFVDGIVMLAKGL